MSGGKGGGGRGTDASGGVGAAPTSTDYLHCPACQNEFNGPKMLPCLHSFCFECLEKSLKESHIGPGQAFLCPICRAQCVVPMRGVKALKSNIFLVTLQEFQDRKTLEKQQECEVCESRRKAKKKCVECNDWLCNPCCAMHQKVKVTKDHNLLTAAELYGGAHDDLVKSSFEPLICNKHGEPLRLYCTDLSCQAPICTVCKTTLGHDGHTAIELDVQANKEAKAITGLLPGVSKGISAMETKIANLKRDDKITNHVRKKMHKAINARMEEVVEKLMKQIGAYAENLHQEVDKIAKDHRRELSKDLEESEFNLESMYHAKGFTETLLDFKRSEELVSMSRDVLSRLNEFQKPVEVAPPRWRQPRLHPHTEASPAAIEALFGKLTFEGEMVKCVLLKAFSAKTEYDERECALCDLSLDSKGHIHVVDRDNRRVKAFDTSGNLKLLTGDNMFKAPNRILHLKKTGRILVKDEKFLRLLNPDGSLFANFGDFLKQPVGLAQNTLGEVLVTEWMSASVVFCDELGVKIGSFPCTCEAPGYVTTSYDQGVMLSDWKEHVIKFFDHEGKYLCQYGGQEGSGDGQLNHPYGICTDKYGHVIIADTWNNRIVLISQDGKFIANLLSKEDGIQYPQAVVVDSKDRLIVVEQRGAIKIYQYMA